MHKASLRTFALNPHVNLFVFRRVRENPIWAETFYFLCCTHYRGLLPIPEPFRYIWWFIDEGPGCTTKRLSLLTPTTTLSSPWNLGRKRSPRKTSDWFRGRKRHSTFILHSAGTSAIAQIQRGGKMLLLLRGKMLPRRVAADRGLTWRSNVEWYLVLLCGDDSDDGG